MSMHNSSSDTTLVYLITGFLGSGKTTFLNKVIQQFPKTRKLTILMNEFGEVGIDGTLVEGEDLNMMEISRGSIFCVCVKTDFIKGLHELSTKVRPDVLIIESTGVANPTDLKRDLQLPIFKNRFQFKHQFCVIDAAHFLDVYDVYASLEKQIASSDVFIINKVDLVSKEIIEQIKEVVSRYHSKPQFFETSYADIPLDLFFPFKDWEKSLPVSGNMQTALHEILSPEEVESFIDNLLDSPDLELTPPDPLVSATLKWKGTDISSVKNLADSLPSSILRAKGFIEDGKRLLLFNYVMGNWTLEPSPVPSERVKSPNFIVIIGPPEVVEEVQNKVSRKDWEAGGLVAPYRDAMK